MQKKKKIVTFGEVMLRLATPGYLRFSQSDKFEAIYGGGEANVAVSLANYHLPVDFVTRLPFNDIGESAVMSLRKYGVDTLKILLRGGDRIGIYFLEKGAVSRGSKVIYDRANSALSQIKSGMIDWEKVFEGAEWFHWTGITPAISEGAAQVCKEAIEKANELGLMVSVDLNFSNKLWKYGKKASEVMPDLVAGCDVILGNEEDAEKVFGIKPEGIDVTTGNVEAAAYESVCKQLLEKFPKAKKVIITLRGSISASHNTWSGVLWNGSDLLKLLLTKLPILLIV